MVIENSMDLNFELEEKERKNQTFLGFRKFNGSLVKENWRQFRNSKSVMDEEERAY